MKANSMTAEGGIQMYYVLNNCGHVSGNAKKWKGYRHIALMQGRLQPYIRNTSKARVIRDATLHVGKTERSKGYRLLQEYERLAEELNRGVSQ